MDGATAAFGVIAAIPQCVQAAKQLYDLRERYKDASVLISAIYSESMVIAASLSQIQGLLEQDTLQRKPELRDTFDSALTGCWVVYTCLQEEVRELADKANGDNLRFRDKTKFLWKEATFKELLTQIRGQQSALSLLIQGLQMDSIAEIRLLVRDNSEKLDNIAKRSNTLRHSRPNLKVPASVFDTESTAETLRDEDSILSSTTFSFDDEVVNATTYRKVMAMAAKRVQETEPISEIDGGALADVDTVSGIADQDAEKSKVTEGAKPIDFQQKSELVDQEPQQKSEDQPAKTADAHADDAHCDLLDALEKDMLPFMLPAHSPSPTLTVVTPSKSLPDSSTNSDLRPDLKPPNPEKDASLKEQSAPEIVTTESPDSGLHIVPQPSDSNPQVPQTAEPKSRPMKSLPDQDPDIVAPSAEIGFPADTRPSLLPRLSGREELKAEWTKTRSGLKNVLTIPIYRSRDALQETTTQVVNRTLKESNARWAALNETTSNAIDKTVRESAAGWSYMTSWGRGSNKKKQAVALNEEATSSSPSIVSLTSTSSAKGVTNFSSEDIVANRKTQRRPLPPTHKLPKEDFGNPVSQTADFVRPPSTADAEMHSTWILMLNAEQEFIDRMTKFRKLFYERIVAEWPALQKHLEIFTGAEQLVSLHEEYLLGTITDQVFLKPDATCNPAVFEAWADNSHNLYQDYCQRLPHVESAIRLTLNMDPKFAPFLNTLGLSLIWFGKGWDDYIRLPLSQLDLYRERLEALIRRTELLSNPQDKSDEKPLRRALETVQRLQKSCLGAIEVSRKREEVQSLYRRIQTIDADILPSLNMTESSRSILLQGGTAFRVNGTGAWHAVHTVLLDNYLLWGKVKLPRAAKAQQRKGDNIWLLEEPIPITELEISLPKKLDQAQKAGFRDEIPKEIPIYEMFVKSKTSKAKPHALGFFAPAQRQEWLDKLNAALKDRTMVNAT